MSDWFCIDFGKTICRYHSDEEIKAKMAELEQDNLVAFDANDNEVSMVVPSLKLTADVSEVLQNI